MGERRVTGSGRAQQLDIVQFLQRVCRGGRQRRYPTAEKWNGTEWSAAGSGIPRPPGGTNVNLWGVSCTASNACTTVGFYKSAGIETMLAERWNGTEWSIQALANPTGVKASSLRSVSCTSSTVCTAAGFYVNSTGLEVTLIERWSGGEWVIQSTPNPAGGTTNYLDGVSCTSASACAAVGAYTNGENSSTALAEIWNGTEWTLQALEGLGGSIWSKLYGVSCSAAGACTGVGEYENSLHVIVPLAERWNGTGWSIQEMARPVGSKEVGPHQVSCSAAGSCVAVGRWYYSIDGSLALVEKWNGTAWSAVELPNPSGVVNSELSGVSCTNSTACTASGSSQLTGYFPYVTVKANLAYGLSGTTWSIESVPSSASSAAVSCASATACVAVGGVESEGEGSSEVWNGAVWSSRAVALPSGAAGFTLSGVSCTAPAECSAVGSYTNSSGTLVSLAEHSAGPVYGFEEGLSWLVQSTPNPSGAKASSLAGVSCTSSSACTAVGRYVNSSSVEVTLAERWNGTEWLVQSTPNPSGAKASSLAGVSCTSSSACTAVGRYVNSSSVEVTLAERWNGTEWLVQSTPNPSGAKASSLAGVSCTSSSACTAVGRYVNSSSVEVTLAERWNGSEWSIQETPNPSGATADGLSGVSCRSSGECTAVGSSSNSKTESLSEHWNGREWAIQLTPNPTGATESAMQGVSCAASPLCVAVGAFTTKNAIVTNLAEVLWASEWSSQETPVVGSSSSYLWEVSCVSPNACTAVGEYENSSHVDVTLAERWNGTEWATQSTPNPTGATRSALKGVSCTSSSACAATGFYKNSSGTYVTLAESWNGTEWSIQSTPNPTGASESRLLGLSCTAAGACTSVGEYQNSSGTYVTLAERWNGTEWSIQSTPNPTGASETALTGVSCASASACTATGYYKNSSGTYVTLAESWNGTAWSVQSTPNPTGAKESILFAISCVAANACTASGWYKNSAGSEMTLAEAWNGTEWSIQSTPNPTGAKGAYLQGLSCTSSMSCTAVGTFLNSSSEYTTLAESWNGREWVIQPTPNPKGAANSYLSGGVSCASPTACTAVGNTGKTLAESYG